ncbi:MULTISPECIES: hypothetical protein [unclassified Lysobacter]|uniref:hypothetical protein n=1 Tax=unclassified Lysobacter TaxID=2635362 RepID=UPI0012FB97BE|nr:MULTISPECIES: hypothetical protein [unclassified Lysobacter]
MRLESSSLPAFRSDVATIALAFFLDRHVADRRLAGRHLSDLHATCLHATDRHAHSLRATDFPRVAVTETVPRDPAFHRFHHPITAIARRPGWASARSSRTEVPRRGKMP